MSNLPTLQVQSIIETIKAIVPRSFEKTFASVSDSGVIAGMQICISDLSQEQINQGLMTVVNKGFCPDPALFRRWCLGQDGFDNADYIADSYIGNSGALANIKRWLSDNTAAISVAEKQAYDDTCHMFNKVEYASNAEFAQAEADRAFKDHYQHIVRELVANRQVCQRYTPPVALPQSKPQETKCEPASKEFVEALFKKHGLKGLSGINKMGVMA